VSLKSSSAPHPRLLLDDPTPWSLAIPTMLTTVNINKHLRFSFLRHLKQNLLYQFLLQSMPPAILLKEAECVSEGAQVRTTSFSSAIP
jgi:hypothetical protein